MFVITDVCKKIPSLVKLLPYSSPGFTVWYLWFIIRETQSHSCKWLHLMCYSHFEAPGKVLLNNCPSFSCIVTWQLWAVSLSQLDHRFPDRTPVHHLVTPNILWLFWSSYRNSNGIICKTLSMGCDHSWQWDHFASRLPKSSLFYYLQTKPTQRTI